MTAELTDFEIGMVGAHAALDTLADMLTEFGQNSGRDADAPSLSLNDVVRLVQVARDSIETE